MLFAVVKFVIKFIITKKKIQIRKQQQNGDDETFYETEKMQKWFLYRGVCNEKEEKRYADDVKIVIVVHNIKHNTLFIRGSSTVVYKKNENLIDT